MRIDRAILCFFLKGAAKAALDCAHRTSTVSSCAFCEQGGRLAAPPHPSKAARCTSTGDRLACPLIRLPRARVPGAQDQRGCLSHPSKLARVRCSRMARVSPPLRASAPSLLISSRVAWSILERAHRATIFYNAPSKLARHLSGMGAD